jgi:hypothetical protein
LGVAVKAARDELGLEGTSFSSDLRGCDLRANGEAMREARYASPAKPVNGNVRL